MEQKEIQKGFFHPVCNPQEIERVFDVKTAKDYLLRLRAETIVDHMRLFRVYRNKALRDEKNWSLEKSFDESHYQEFLSRLDPDSKRLCEETTFGNIFSNDPNGTIEPTDYGRLITISDSLRFFLKFIHLGLMDFGTKVPPHVRGSAIKIAIRVMLKTEALDFFMDPRGIVPQDIGEAIHEPIPFQMQFIAGHEFAHHILGHLSEVNIGERPTFFAISPRDEEYRLRKIYNKSQKQEFEADVLALTLPNYNEMEAKIMLESVLIWFGSMELYEAICEGMCPKNPWDYRTHPSAQERYENILMKIKTPKGFKLAEWKNFSELINFMKKSLLDDLSLNFETYEEYGSVYLDKPNSDWRGPELRDRIDYY